MISVGRHSVLGLLTRERQVQLRATGSLLIDCPSPSYMDQHPTHWGLPHARALLNKPCELAHLNRLISKKVFTPFRRGGN